MPARTDDGTPALDVRPLDLDAESLEACADLLQRTFPRAGHVTPAYLHWEYCENPDGRAFGWNAFDDDRLVSHCVVQPLRARLFGEEVRGVLSLNAATDPSYQRGGCYFELAERTYADARSQGYAFGVAVTNDRSTPGFVSRIGFQLVGSLEVRVGAGKVHRSDRDAAVDLEKLWSSDSLAWRLASPTIPYRVGPGDAEVPITGPAGLPGVSVPMAEIPPELAAALPADLTEKTARSGGPLEVWVGLDPAVDWGRSLYLPLPRILRPSPLYLIFLDLTGRDRQLELGRVRWRALDFDDF